jgi:hypothetical protein
MKNMQGGLINKNQCFLFMDVWSGGKTNQDEL